MSKTDSPVKGMRAMFDRIGMTLTFRCVFTFEEELLNKSPDEATEFGEIVSTAATASGISNSPKSLIGEEVEFGESIISVKKVHGEQVIYISTKGQNSESIYKPNFKKEVQIFCSHSFKVTIQLEKHPRG